LAILPIYIYNQSVLRKKAKPVKSADEELIKFVEDMFETMHKANGIGLAATQVGSLQRVIVVDVSDLLKEKEESGDMNDEEIPPEARAPIAMINPVVLLEEGEWVMEEGCLSIPDIREEVERAEAIQVKYKDLNMQDKELFADGLFARVILHEIDHLNGVLFIDRLGKVKQKLLKGRLNKIRRGEIEVSYPIVTETVEAE
jgi:peptide deformylase